MQSNFGGLFKHASFQAAKLGVMAKLDGIT